MASYDEEKLTTAPGRRTVVAGVIRRAGWRTGRCLPEDAAHLLAEIREKLSGGQALAALDLLRRLKADQPASFWQGGRWRLWEETGRALLGQTGTSLAAADAFTVLHSLRPHHVPTLLRLGVALAAAGEYGRAFHAYYTACELDPENAEAHYQLGELYEDRGDVTRALRYLERATALAPESGDYWAAFGYALQLAGENERARACYEKAARRLPDDPVVWNALGLLYAQAGEPEAGVRALRRGLRLRKDDPGILLNLSTVYGRDLGEYRRALRYARRLLALEPRNAGAHHNLGLIYWALGDLEEAESHLRKALELGPEAPEIWASYNTFRRFMSNL